MTRKSYLFVFLTSLFFLALSTSGFAQDLDNVTIQGQITDSNNAPIVGATVTATSTTTGVARTAVTNDEGRFLVLRLEPGIYNVKFSANGFGTKEQKDLATIAGQTVQLSISLAPAGVTAEQTITIDGDDAPAVDTTRTVVGGTVTQREIEELPNNSRNALDLVFTLGGVTEEQLSTRDLSSDRGKRGITAPGTTPEEAGTFALSGGVAYSNNITIDGLDNNDDRSATFRFQPSIESVAEVQVITNQFSAEYGRASGGRVNIRTRAGGNKYRGRAFYFFRDDALNANTWNNKRRGIEIPPLNNHNPGFTFGGPIVKNRLFFFTAYEYDKIREDTLLDAFVPVNNTNTKFPLPAPTNPTEITSVTSGSQTVQIAPYVVPVDTPANKHLFSARSDWNLNNRHNFTFGYQLGRTDDLRAFSGTNRISDSLIGRKRNTDAFNATHNFVVSSSIINQIRVQYSQLRPRAAQVAGELAPAVLVTAPAGTQVFGSTSGATDRKENRLQIQDTLSWVVGSHTLKLGGDVHKVDTTFIDRFDATGTYSFSNFVFFNNNSVSRYQHNFNTTSDVKNTYFGVFFHDDWRIRSNFSLSYGIRYEKERVVDDNNNFGPRFAIAWNPLPKAEKTVIRFGGGIFYNRVLLRTIDDFNSDSQALRLDTNSLNVPAGTTVDLNVVRAYLSNQFPNPLTLDSLIPVNATQSFPVRQLVRRSTVFRSLNPDLVIPESYQFNLGIEREMLKGLVFETNVTYNKTVHLWREVNPNAPVLPPGLSDRNNNGELDFSDYLLGITTGNSLFELGPTNDPVGLRRVGGGSCTAGTQACIVNLNTTNNNSNCSTTAVTNNPICRAFSVINTLRPFFSTLGSAQVERIDSIGDSQYLGATFELRSRNRKFGLGFSGSMRFVYTLSSLRDDGIVNTSDATIPGDFNREWSRSLLDRRHRIAFSGTFDTPFWLGKLRFSPFFRYGSSAPFNISIGGNDRNLDDLSNDRPNYFGSPSSIKWRKFGSPFPESLANDFALAPIGSPGNLRRNAGHGPSHYIFDLNVSREFRVKERFRIRPTAELNNVLNATVFSFGSNFIDFENLNSTNPTTLATARANFLSPTRTVRARQIRLGVRIDF